MGWAETAGPLARVPGHGAWQWQRAWQRQALGEGAPVMAGVGDRRHAAAHAGLAAAAAREMLGGSLAAACSCLQVYVRATGGEVGAASSLAPKIGPLGLSPKKVRGRRQAGGRRRRCPSQLLLKGFALEMQAMQDHASPKN